MILVAVAKHLMDETGGMHLIPDLAKIQDA